DFSAESNLAGAAQFPLPGTLKERPAQRARCRARPAGICCGSGKYLKSGSVSSLAGRFGLVVFQSPREALSRIGLDLWSAAGCFYRLAWQELLSRSCLSDAVRCRGCRFGKPVSRTLEMAQGRLCCFDRQI